METRRSGPLVDQQFYGWNESQPTRRQGIHPIGLLTASSHSFPLILQKPLTCAHLRMHQPLPKTSSHSEHDNCRSDPTISLPSLTDYTRPARNRQRTSSIATHIPSLTTTSSLVPSF